MYRQLVSQSVNQSVKHSKHSHIAAYAMNES